MKLAGLSFSSSLAFLSHAVAIKITIQFLLSCYVHILYMVIIGLILLNKPGGLVAEYLKHVTQLPL